MKLFFSIVYIRIISLRWKFDDHPLVEYPLLTYSMISSLNIFYLFQQLVSSFKEKSLEHQHGILLAIGYAFGLNILKNKAKKKDKEWRLFRF